MLREEEAHTEGTGIEKFPKTGDIIYMNDFAKGMNSVGQLFPSPSPYSDYPSPNSAWKGVANSFHQAGNSLRFAIRECSDAKRESKQTP